MASSTSCNAPRSRRQWRAIRGLRSESRVTARCAHRWRVHSASCSMNLRLSAWCMPRAARANPRPIRGVVATWCSSRFAVRATQRRPGAAANGAPSPQAWCWAVLISWKLLAPSEPMMAASGNSLVARGALASALDRQLASTQLESDPVWIGLSFQASDGHICRSFELRDAGTAGLGCKVDGEWRIPVTSETPARSGGVRQAASPPAAVLRVIEARISGDPLDPAAEEKARDAGWKAARR